MPICAEKLEKQYRKYGVGQNFLCQKNKYIVQKTWWQKIFEFGKVK